MGEGALPFCHGAHIARQLALIEPEDDQRRDGPERAEAAAVERMVRHLEDANMAALLAVDDGASVAIRRGCLLGLGAGCRRWWIWEEGHAAQRSSRCDAEAVNASHT